MSEAGKHDGKMLTKEEIDKLLEAALPNGKIDFFWRKKKAFRKLMEALEKTHEPLLHEEAYEVHDLVKNTEELELLAKLREIMEDRDLKF